MQTNSAELLEYIRAAPKAELHVHLEGSIQPAALLQLAARNGVALPAHDIAGLNEWFRFRDFNHFIQVYLMITRCLKTRADYEFIVLNFAREAARQNIRYAEVTFTPGTHAWLGIGAETYLAGLKSGRDKAKKEYGVEINWIFDIVRNADEAQKWADYTIRIALEFASEGVVALGLGGKEDGYPPDLFQKWFEKARGAGLHSAPHAGEGLGPASIWGAIRALGAERIGHGVRAIEDPELIEYLRAKEITLEVCPTSNVCLGIFPDLASHPVARLMESGVSITINSDDPPLFNTTLTNEFELMAKEFNLDAGQADTLLLNGVRRSFLSKQRRDELLREFESALAKLKGPRPALEPRAAI